jgi:NAD(P)-dependent dehydrogenase (short-subunit alcohol dehydrogenase family)
VLAATVEAFGQANLVCLNAGVGGNPPVAGEWVHLPSWKWVMDVNFWGVVNGFRTFLPHLSEHGDGHIVTTASMAGLLPGFSAYNASKFAVTGITEGLYNQLQAMRSPLGVSCLCPGFVATNIMTSTRNRPEWAALPPDAAPPDPEVEVRMAAVGDRIAGGKPPAEVADLVHDAVVEGRFWIFTDDEFLPYAAERHRSIEAATNPELWRRSAV